MWCVEIVRGKYSGFIGEKQRETSIGSGRFFVDVFSTQNGNRIYLETVPFGEDDFITVDRELQLQQEEGGF